MNTMASDEPNIHESASSQKCTFLNYVENNPVAAVIQALAIGFAVGMIVRLIEGSREKEPKIDVKHKPTLDEAKFHLGSLLLPYLLPAWEKAREGYGKSAETVRETVKEAVNEVKKGDFAKKGKRHLKEFEKWVEPEAESIAEHLAETGQKKAKDVEEWVQKEVLPSAECGWKKLENTFRRRLSGRCPRI